MKKVVWGAMIAAALALALKPAFVVVAAPSSTLDMYFIDVEGGQSTLIITPAGQSLLVDAGYAGFDNRDPERILTAARAAGITQIDYLLLTHFHPDHDGGVVEIARQMPIRTFSTMATWSGHQPFWQQLFGRPPSSGTTSTCRSVPRASTSNRRPVIGCR